LIDLIIALTIDGSGIALTLYKSHVHYAGVKQWWACSSLMSSLFPAEAGCETCERIVLLLVFIA